MAIFSFNKRFSNVDLPTLDRPMMATVPNFTAAIAPVRHPGPTDTRFRLFERIPAVPGLIVLSVRDHVPSARCLRATFWSSFQGPGCPVPALEHDRAWKKIAGAPFHQSTRPGVTAGPYRRRHNGRQAPTAVASPTTRANRRRF